MCAQHVQCKYVRRIRAQSTYAKHVRKVRTPSACAKNLTYLGVRVFCPEFDEECVHLVADLQSQCDLFSPQSLNTLLINLSTPRFKSGARRMRSSHLRPAQRRGMPRAPGSGRGVSPAASPAETTDEGSALLVIKCSCAAEALLAGSANGCACASGVGVYTPASRRARIG